VKEVKTHLKIKSKSRFSLHLQYEAFIFHISLDGVGVIDCAMLYGR